jgi:trypsin
MAQKLPLATHKVRTAAFCLAAAAGVALSGGCAVEGASLDAADHAALGSGQQSLIGGRPAAADEFRSTVGIADDCTAAKVGPRLFLTAAHCVDVPRPFGPDPVPEDFPPNAGVGDGFLPGEPLLVFWGLDADDEEQAELTIVQTSIHPSWWDCPLCQLPTFNAAADIAVIEIAEDTPEIPEARVALGTVPVGTAVVEVGWGCEQSTNQPGPGLGRYKTAAGEIIDVSEAQRFTRIGDEQLVDIDASYLITAGSDQDANAASLCLGDSGGPLYLPDNGDPRIVGVNSDFTFRPDQPEPGGVSWTDWHTRTSRESLHGVGQWLIDRGVNTVE